MRRSGLGARLGRSFLLQAALISVTAVVGVFAASLLLEGVLIREALREEAEHFWTRRAADPGFALPDTNNLTGFMTDAPPALRTLPAGFHDAGDGATDDLVYVTERDGERLYLVFDRRNVGALATYYGLAPLAMVLLVLYLSTWLGFRVSRRAISPVIALARQVRDLDPRAPDPSALRPETVAPHADDEVRELAAAIARYAQRLGEFVEREQQFTRDASHELRSPLTVIRVAAGILRADPQLGAASSKALDRIERAAGDMEELINAFLLLARDADQGLPSGAVCVNDVVAEELERARLMAGDKPIEASVQSRCRLMVQAPEKVLAVMIGNLLRNAFSYTDAGRITVTVDEDGVAIADTGIGMPAGRVQDMYRPFVRGDANRGGHGVGLTIVRRLSDRFGWPVEIDSQPGEGTRVVIAFPDATTQPIGAPEH
ncbi:MAG TPA: HAMP domain-containing sensor histidine kinase [Steroidobacteraceae bacterium]|nr:HAMP domain-containing sensor histidine kinase [Steroidobacteraceae bacterium]